MHKMRLGVVKPVTAEIAYFVILAELLFRQVMVIMGAQPNYQLHDTGSVWAAVVLCV